MEVDTAAAIAPPATATPKEEKKRARAAPTPDEALASREANAIGVTAAGGAPTSASGRRQRSAAVAGAKAVASLLADIGEDSDEDEETETESASESEYGRPVKAARTMASRARARTPSRKAASLKRASGADSDSDFEGDGEQVESEEEELEEEPEEDRAGGKAMHLDGQSVGGLWDETATAGAGAAGGAGDADGEAAKASQSSMDDFVVDDKPKRKRAPASKSRAPRPSRSRKSGGGASTVKVEATELPAIREPQLMFSDMVQRMGGVVEAAKEDKAFASYGDELGDMMAFAKDLGRPLRVATMCSGTESPLLALSMISKALDQGHDIKLDIDHVFSCEIEPFKQGYIERNFAPPILFRDIRELGDDQAHTAWGALVDVPGNVDILVAGTSCVDYSNLNNEKKELDAQGESGQTFRGMMRWIDKMQPPLIILENVCGAPWERIRQDFLVKHNYHATFTRFDTKQYYIPHTRMRVYLVATPVRPDVAAKVQAELQRQLKLKKLPHGGHLDPNTMSVAFSKEDGGNMSKKKKEDAVAKWFQDLESIAAEDPASRLPAAWKDLVKRMNRSSSSVLEAFLLPNDDPRVHIAREKLANKARARGRAAGGKGTDWARCEARHQRARLEEGLGAKRPFTNWEDASACELYDYAWTDWARAQTDRVLDLMDIDFLRLAAVKEVDPSFKTLVWNLSQNVDRTTGSVKPGICPCLTPSMVPFVTNRGGPLVGVEALSLQGIPVDDLILTRETEDQMADLAGNAMSSTVVGVCAMVALALGKALVREGPGKDAVRSAKDGQGETAKSVHTDAVDGDLHTAPLMLAPSSHTSARELLARAERARRYCVSEGQTAMAEKISVCRACGHTVSGDGGRPKHDFEVFEGEREAPAPFAAALKAAIPMRVALVGLSEAALKSSMAAAVAAGADEALAAQWASLLAPLNVEGFFFRSINRAVAWTASYAARTSGATLDLVLDGGMAEWRLSVPPPVEKGPLRDMLMLPVARMRVPADKDARATLTSGEWQLRLPVRKVIKVAVEGKGERVPTWQASMGLAKRLDDVRFGRWSICVNDTDRELLDEDISGEYTLLPDCDAAMASLHRREGAAADEAATGTMYFFVDAGAGRARCSYKEEDHFVFARSHRRLAYGEERGAVCRLDAAWRPHATDGPVQVACEIVGQWRGGCGVGFATTGVASPAKGRAAAASEAVIQTPQAPPPMVLTGDSWRQASTIVKCAFPKPDADAKLFPADEWASLPLDKSTAEFKRLAWITERVDLPSPLKVWNDSADAPPEERCETCAPSPPAIQWVLDFKGKVAAREDPQMAADFERRTKARPPPFLVQLRAEGEDRAQLRVAVNTPSLGHRALSLLPPATKDAASASPTRVSWRVVAESEEAPATAGATPLPFTLSSNKTDAPADQPPHFKRYPLRPEQLRSLGWMLQQERQPRSFVEEEVIEARLPALRWRAEGRATRAVEVRGGVVADQVGYGKTAITLGLIDAQIASAKAAVKAATKAPLRGAIRTSATLVLAPAHLLKQWPNEVRKFTGSALSIEVINTAANLNRLTIKRIQEVDLIIMASGVFRSEVYFERMAALGGVSQQLAATKSNARHFEATYGIAVENIEDRVEELMGEGGAAAVYASIKASAEADLDVTDLNPKRLKGSSLVKATELAMSKGFRTHGGMLGKVAGEGKDGVNAGVGKDAAKGAGVAAAKEEAVAGSGSETDDNNDDGCAEEDDWAPARKKQKGAAGKANAKKKGKVAASGSRGKQGKATVSADPWGLKTSAVKSNWRHMKCPPLELFHWERVVVDEFTYLKGRDLAAIQALKASNKWVLSGTPPVGTFDDIKGIARFLSVHLGVDEAPKFSKAEQTKAETFAFYRESHTPAWHARRRMVAQSFLDAYVRQNVAEIDEIRRVQEDVAVSLLPAERAIYLELDHHLQAMDMQTTKKWRKGAESGDRVARLKEVLGSSATAEEALLKRAAHFDLGATASSALDTCEEIVSTREAQLAQCKAELVGHIKVGFALDRMCELWADRADCEYATASKHETVPFLRWIRTINTESAGDPEATLELRRLVRQATDEYAEMRAQRVPMTLPAEPSRLFDGEWRDPWSKNAKLKVESEAYGEWAKQRKFYAREWTHAIRRLEKEIVGRERSLRYFRAVRDLQKDPSLRVTCPVVGKVLAPEEHGVLSCCGHAGELKAMRERAALQRCVVEGCQAPVRVTSVVERATLGTDAAHGEHAAGTYGSKLKELVRIIKAVPPTERVLVFVQFADLAELVCQALGEASIDVLELKGSIFKKTSALEIFQREKPAPGDPRVLLLNQSDESASGANLTTANHAIFVHPLLAATQQEYNQGLTQAVGRVCRYGQDKLVHIRHLLVEGTMDATVFAERGGIDCCV